MIDRGLLATLAVAVAVVSVLDRRLRRRAAPKDPVLTLAWTPLMAGLAVGRMAAVALDDPATLQRPFDLLLIRGGTEFWPGVAAAAVAVWVAGRRGHFNALDRMAELAPFALWAGATYEAACLLRDGCFGPASPLGLRPGGLGERQIPVGVMVGLAAGALGVGAWRWSRRLPPHAVIALSLTGLAAIRSAAGFVLPKLTAGLSRPHQESLTALVLGLFLCAGVFAARRDSSGRGRHSTEREPSAPSPRPDAISGAGS